MQDTINFINVVIPAATAVAGWISHLFYLKLNRAKMDSDVQKLHQETNTRMQENIDLLYDRINKLQDEYMLLKINYNKLFIDYQKLQDRVKELEK